VQEAKRRLLVLNKEVKFMVPKNLTNQTRDALKELSQDDADQVPPPPPRHHNRPPRLCSPAMMSPARSLKSILGGVCSLRESSLQGVD